MRLNDILIERRTGGDLNAKLSSYEELKQYKDDPNIFISFTDVDKIGINPQSKFETPLGVYTYPLNTSWEGFNHKGEKILVPFAGDRPYIYVVKAINPPLEVEDYTSEQLEQDMGRVSDIIFRDLQKSGIARDSRGRVQRVIQRGRDGANNKHPFVVMWYTTKLLAELYGGKSMVKWNYLLRKLGYSGFVDRGRGFIHPSEPIQCVFLTATAFKSVDKIQNSQPRPRINKMVDYANKLITADKTVPKHLLDAIIGIPEGRRRLAAVYSRNGKHPPIELVNAMLKYGGVAYLSNLFLGYQQYKRLPYPPIMVKYLNDNPKFVALITKSFLDTRYYKEVPPEVSSALDKHEIDPSV